jgi:hypothetical protein
VDVECPRAIARVEHMLKSLEAYGQVSSPRPDTATAAAAGGGGTGSITRQTDDVPSPAAETAGAPPPGDTP